MHKTALIAGLKYRPE